MADDLDRARKHQERLNAAAVQHRQPEPNLEAVGICYNPMCLKDVDGERRFCDSDCADEWERLQRREAARRG